MVPLSDAVPLIQQHFKNKKSDAVTEISGYRQTGHAVPYRVTTDAVDDTDDDAVDF